MLMIYCVHMSLPKVTHKENYKLLGKAERLWSDQVTKISLEQVTQSAGSV